MPFCGHVLVLICASQPIFRNMDVELAIAAEAAAAETQGRAP
jgi:hypothetical protein